MCELKVLKTKQAFAENTHIQCINSVLKTLPLSAFVNSIKLIGGLKYI